MPRKQFQSVGDMIKSAKDKIVSSEMISNKIPDIITFCNDPYYLDLVGQGIYLYPSQIIMLKIFYKGTPGNENIFLTAEEIEWCKKNGLDNVEDRGDVVGKYNNNTIFRELILVWGRGCISEDSIFINPKDGMVHKIGDLYKNGIKNISSYTYDENQKEMVVVDNAEIIYQGKRDVYKVSLFSGDTIEITDNHPLFTENGWKSLSKIDITKDKIAVATSVPFFGNSEEITEDEAALLGYITGDGCCTSANTFITISDNEILKDFKERLYRFSDNLILFKDPWTGARSRDSQYKIKAKTIKNERGYDPVNNRYFSRHIKNDLKKLLVKYNLSGKWSKTKTVPDELFRCKKEVIASYLKALFSCDGYIGVYKCNKHKPRALVGFSTISEEQAIKVKTLLLKFGLHFRKRTHKVNTKIVDEKGDVRTYNTHNHVLTVSRKNDVLRFISEIGILGRDDNVKAVLDFLDTVKVKEDKSLFKFEKIEDIKIIGEKETFDISVSDENHLKNFISQGILCHNSSKDFVSSIIACYEAMKLLETPGGNPYKVYNLSSANPITILTVAVAAPQAGVAFGEIKNKIIFSKYFQDKIDPEGWGLTDIYLYTPDDRIKNKELVKRGLRSNRGSIWIHVGHSNSDSQVGGQIFVLILDEVAAYKQTSSSSGGERILTALQPSLSRFSRIVKVKDENGDEVERNVFDSKIIYISSPRGKDGLFYRIYKESHLHNNTLMCKLPTWIANPTKKLESLRSEWKGSEEDFWMEYGAEFSGQAGSNMFRPDKVKECFSPSLSNRTIGQPGFVYFAHLDPATSSHNYALVVVHRESFMNKETHSSDYRVVVDHIKYWNPSHEKPISIDEIDNYLIALKRQFFLGMVTYDQWNCLNYLTRVCTEQGLKYAIDIQPGDKIYDCFGNLETINKKEVDLNAKCLKIRTKFGYEVIATYNHPLWMKDRFVQARDLVVGDKINLQDFICFGKTHDVQSALMMGYLISEGSISDKYRLVSFTNTDKNVVEDFTSCAISVVGSAPTSYKRTFPDQKHWLPAWNLRYFGKKYEKIKNMGFSGDSYTKEVPNFVLNGDKETVAAFLSSLFEGDGNVGKNPSVLSVEYNTSSEKLAKDVHLLLLCFGIKSSLKRYGRWKGQKHYIFYRILIYGENIDIFAKEIGFRSPCKKEVLAEVLNLKNKVDLRPLYKTRVKRFKGLRKITGKKASRSRQMTDRIILIEETDSTICHLEVSGSHTFISNGLMSHNSFSSIEKMKKHGIPAKRTTYNKSYKQTIFTELENLINSGRLLIPHHELLMNEMIYLQRKVRPNGFTVCASKDAEVNSDDLVMSLAGACYNATVSYETRLVSGKLVNTGISPTSNSRMWNSMSGPIGWGPGEVVARNLENRGRRGR